MKFGDRMAALIVLCLASVAFAQTGQINRVTNPGVQDRMNTMNSANAALTVLGDMMGGRALFDKDRAKAARHELKTATRRIPAVFRKPHTDPLSQAKPVIWQQWSDFKSRAKATQRAVRALDTDSLPDLRRTLPRVVQSCLNCHKTYRRALR